MRFLNAYDQCMNRIIKALEALATVLMILMTAVCFVNVVCRFVLLIPLVWADELMRYSSVWVVFVLCPVLVVQKGHLMVDMTTLLMPRVLWKPMLVFGNLMCAAFMAIMLPQAFRMIAMGRVEKSVALGLPMTLVYMCVPLSVFLMTLCFTRIAAGELFPETAALPAFRRRATEENN